MSENLFDQNIWSTGNQKSKSDQTHNLIMTSSKRYGNTLFQKKAQDPTVETAQPVSENTQMVEKSVGPDDAARATFGNAIEVLKKNGYSHANYDEKMLSHIEKAVKDKGELVSRYTGRPWIDKSGYSQEAPADVFPKKLKIGDRAQVLNWQPLGVHRAVVDLFPASGTVTKIYTVKAMIAKDPAKMEKEDSSGKGGAFTVEERVLGVELDGHGPGGVAKGGGDTIPMPFITKESSIIFRMPVLGDPAGNTEHQQPNMI